MIPCAGCRVRHLKCDSRSTCNECEKSGRPCMRLNVRFRNLVCPADRTTHSDHKKYHFFFEDEQTWIDTSGKLEFIAEDDLGNEVLPSEQLERDPFKAVVKEGEFQPTLAERQSSTFNSETIVDNPPVQTPGLDDDLPDYLTASEPTPYDPPQDTLLDGGSKWSAHPMEEKYEHVEKGSANTGMAHVDSVLPTTQLEWPLESLHEAKLLQHFVTHLAPWFDVGDGKRHFGKVVPCMAASSPFLMAAVLAIAALHHSRVNSHSDMYNAMTFHDRCLNMIVSMLSDSDRFNDDGLAVTTTILHLYDGLESGNDLPRHLKGTSIFFPTEVMSNWSQLRRAVFWLHLRQEIYNAYLYQRSVITDLSYCEIEPDSNADDDVWFHQTLYIAALVTKWAFGEEASYAEWYGLCKMLDVWEDTRPSTFDPIYFRTRDAKTGRFFPEVCYATDEHVAAAHFFYMAKLLLTTHDPSLPRIGPRMKPAAAAMQETALSYVRTLVGIAACNTLIIARFTANLAVNICASWFTDPREQRALLDFMHDTSKCSGWERRNAQRALIQEWGLDV